MQDWLWLAGLPIPPRPLHHQAVLQRAICVSEKMDLHLVWTAGRIYMKPLPRYLLDPGFWSDHLCTAAADDTAQLYKLSLGFLYSYVALITYETDFHLAQSLRLLPREVSWSSWKAMVSQLQVDTLRHRVDRRFLHGELRLGRLNKIYFFHQTPFSAYVPLWNQTRTFFQDNLAWLASATVYMVIVLTSMQLGVATKPLANSDAFQYASYGFAIFSILAPLVIVAGIVVVFLFLSIYNIAKTRRFNRRKIGENL